MDSKNLPIGTTDVAALMPVEQYALLCVTARRIGCDPAVLVGWLIEKGAAAELAGEVA